MLHIRRKKDTEPQAGSRKLIRPASRNTTVFSYHAYRSSRDDASGRSVAQNPMEDERPRRSSKARANTTITIVVAIIIIAGIGANLRLSSTPKLVILGDSTSRIFLQNMNVYQKAAQKDLASSAFDGNKATFDATHISDELRAQFPELAAVSVSLPLFGSQPTIYMLPVDPQLVLQDAAGQRYILDDSGRVLATDTSQVTHGVSFSVPTIVDQSGLPIVIGRLALPDTTVAYIAEVAGQLHAAGVTVGSYTLPGGGASELDAQITGQPYIVRFNLHGNARIEVGDYLATAKYLSQNNKKASQYIDVMVDGRSYYK
jgi:hypothetical protein